MRIACLATTIVLALAGADAWAQSAPVTFIIVGHPAGLAPAEQPQRILVSGLAPDVPTATIQDIVQKSYQLAVATTSPQGTLGPAQLQSVADKITAALHKEGFVDAQASPPFTPGLADTVAPPAAPAQALADNVVPPVKDTVAPPAAPAQALADNVVPPVKDTVAPPAVPAPALADNVVPPVKDRDAGAAATQQLAVSAFRVQGVGEHPKYGITPASMQALANAQLKKRGGGDGQVAHLTFAQLNEVATALTDRYRKAGYIFGTAFLPAQTVGPDQTIEIHVLEGQFGQAVVKGTKRYRAGVIAAMATPLKGKPLRKDDVDTAILYAQGLPGVKVTSTFQPGEHEGQTDLVMVANEAKRPFTITTGANNYGTDVTGKYRAQLGGTWNSPLGIGDSFTANIDYALDPQNNIYYALAYHVPVEGVRGLSGVVGANRSDLQLNNGSFGLLKVNGPSANQYVGADWQFVNTPTLQMQATLHYINETSSLRSTFASLSDERFKVAEATWALSHTDTTFKGVDLLQVGIRKSISDDSKGLDFVSPSHAHDFLTTRVSYTRLQLLTQSQRLAFKFSGQYSNQALPPLEQFVIGGPDSVRAYPIADALSDSGFYAALEYHVDAPGIGDKPSPFYGRPWRELLELEAFVDYGRDFTTSVGNRGKAPVTLRGYGAGFIFRLPRFKHFEFHLDGALPIGGPEPTDKNGYRIYSRFGLTF